MGKAKFATALLILGLISSASGCRKRSVQAAPPAVIVPSRQPHPAPSHPESRPEPAPETQPAPPPGAKKPAAPAPATPKETSEPAPPKPAPPQISPQLSPQEQAEDERKANQNIDEAEKNLRRAYGRELTAAQHDLVEKIRNFVTQSREAIRNSDWVRARNLSQKAYLLSVELANSL